MMLFNILQVGDMSLSSNDQSVAFPETYSRQAFHMKTSILEAFQTIFLKCQIYSVQIIQLALVESTSEEISALTTH